MVLEPSEFVTGVYVDADGTGLQGEIMYMNVDWVY